MLISLRKVSVLLIIISLLFMQISEVAAAMSADEIIARVDENQYADSARMEAEMVIVKGDRELKKSMKIISEGKSALVEFTNPRDRGTKFLKVEDNLWMYFPDAEEIVKISGHMLEQGVMGSDFSYQDLMESEKLTDLYDFKLMREEELDGRACYVLEGVAREGVDVSYYRRLSWIDRERFVVLKEEFYAQSGRLLKIMLSKKVQQFGDRWYITEAVMEDKLRKNTRTEFRVTSIEFDVEIPDDTFTLENLR